MKKICYVENNIGMNQELVDNQKTVVSFESFLLFSVSCAYR